MDKFRKNIVILEPSKVLSEGLSSSITKVEHNYYFYYLDDLNDIEALHLNKEVSMVLINPILIQNRLQDFNKLKRQFPDIYWIGIIYSFFDTSLLNKLDDSFSITDDITTITRKINLISNNQNSSFSKKEELSERESDVLKWLAKGLSNKEIADRLNISIHTVNTHRRNIMDKTGIKSLAGLTIYAVSKGLIPLE